MESNMYKLYVDVTARFTKDGELYPVSIKLEDGRQYDIDRIMSKRRAASLKAGGEGIRYDCIIGGKRTFIFYEENYHWFIENNQPVVC